MIALTSTSDPESHFPHLDNLKNKCNYQILIQCQNWMAIQIQKFRFGMGKNYGISCDLRYFYLLCVAVLRWRCIGQLGQHNTSNDCT
jgi:hypothetical protein